MKSFKKVLILISLLCGILLCFSGCSDANEVGSDNKESEQAAGEAATDIDKASEQEITLEGFYYTIYLPADWQDRYTRDDITDGDCRYDVFCQTASMNREGGHIFSIVLMPKSEDYTELPSYDYLGTLKTPEGEYTMLAVYPTDVQFSEETADEYNEMAADTEHIVKTIKAAEGAELVKN